MLRQDCWRKMGGGGGGGLRGKRQTLTWYGGTEWQTERKREIDRQKREKCNITSYYATFTQYLWFQSAKDGWRSAIFLITRNGWPSIIAALGHFVLNRISRTFNTHNALSTCKNDEQWKNWRGPSPCLQQVKSSHQPYQKRRHSTGKI